MQQQQQQTIETSFKLMYSEYYDKDIFIPIDQPFDEHPCIFDHLAINDPDYHCTNCTCYGFPCVNCNEFVYDNKITPSVKFLKGKKWADISQDENDDQWVFEW